MLDSDYKKYIKYKTKYLNLRGGTLLPVQIEIYKLLLIKLKLLRSLLALLPKKVTENPLISNILNYVNININLPLSEKQYEIKILDPIDRLKSDIQQTVEAYMKHFSFLADPYVLTYIITVVENEVIYYGYYKTPYYRFGQVKSGEIEEMSESGEIEELLTIRESTQIDKSAQIVEEYAKIVEESAKIVGKSPRLYYFGRVPEHDMKGRDEMDISKEQSQSNLLEVLTKIEKLLQLKSIKMRKSDDSINITYIDIEGGENLSDKPISITNIESTRNLSINYNKGEMDFDDVKTMSPLLKKQFEKDGLIIILFDIDVLHLFNEKYKLFTELHKLNNKIIIIFPSRIYNLDSSHLEEYIEGLSDDIELSSLSEPQLVNEQKPLNLNPNTYLIVFSVPQDRNLKNETTFPFKISFTFTSKKADVLNKIKNNEPLLTALLAWIRRKNPENCFENMFTKLIKSNVTHSEKILTIDCKFLGSRGGQIAFSEVDYNHISQLFAITTLDITSDAYSKYSYFVPNEFTKNLTLMCSKKICTD